MAASCLFHISCQLLAPPHLEIVTGGKIRRPTYMQQRIFLTENFWWKLVFTHNRDCERGIFSRICCRIFLSSSQKSAKMLSFEEDFQDVCMLPRSARKVSQVLNSFLISSSQFCFYLFAVATITHRDTFLYFCWSYLHFGYFLSTWP